MKEIDELTEEKIKSIAEKYGKLMARLVRDIMVADEPKKKIKRLGGKIDKTITHPAPNGPSVEVIFNFPELPECRTHTIEYKCIYTRNELIKYE